MKTNNVNGKIELELARLLFALAAISARSELPLQPLHWDPQEIADWAIKNCNLQVSEEILHVAASDLFCDEAQAHESVLLEVLDSLVSKGKLTATKELLGTTYLPPKPTKKKRKI